MISVSLAKYVNVRFKAKFVANAVFFNDDMYVLVYDEACRPLLSLFTSH
jgi:hypothetical protein